MSRRPTKSTRTDTPVPSTTLFRSNRGAAAGRCGARGRLNATLLAEETGVPLPPVQKLVSKLSAAGLIETLRGTGGGLRLARPPATTNLADIIEPVDGPIAMTTCLAQCRPECFLEENRWDESRLGAGGGSACRYLRSSYPP